MPLLRIRGEVLSIEKLLGLLGRDDEAYVNGDEGIIHMPERGLVITLSNGVIEVITEFGNASEAIRLLRELRAFNIRVLP
ncbi:hypothetical protein JCM16161A_02160 [Vulcanisaeta sp. JCM 16161]|uniref:hypothetical protein n=1 Tax=Vulcanisaeta sp. JCM 16161 TaxID=1295372 RepID=UPI00406D2AE2